MQCNHNAQPIDARRDVDDRLSLDANDPDATTNGIEALADCAANVIVGEHS
jgi:hypothetical protein